MKQSLIIILAIALMAATAQAHEGMDEEMEMAELLINSKTPCSELTDKQLEMIGDYYMEQMHPGEEHETVEEMMGGEGSENLKQVHMGMGRAMYCGEQDAMPKMMMDMMMGNGMMPNAGMNQGGMNRNAYTGIGTLPSSVKATAAILTIAAASAALILWQKKKTKRNKK